MCSSGPKGQTQAALLPQGRADLRAAERSADERSEAEAPKQRAIYLRRLGPLGIISSASCSPISSTKQVVSLWLL